MLWERFWKREISRLLVILHSLIWCDVANPPARYQVLGAVLPVTQGSRLHYWRHVLQLAHDHGNATHRTSQSVSCMSSQRAFTALLRNQTVR